MNKLAGYTLMLSLFAGAACAMLGQTGTWRYKLTLVVDDNGVERSGSSVVEVHVDRSGFKLTPESTPRITVKGEATVVDLGTDGTLFAVLGNRGGKEDAWQLVFDAFPYDHGGSTPEGIEYYSHLRAKRDLPFDLLPMLVRFRNIDDPKTVEKIDPNDLSKNFGARVKLIKAMIEMTDEPITKGIQEKIKWLPQRKDIIGYLGGWPNDPSKTFLNGSELSKGIIK